MACFRALPATSPPATPRQLTSLGPPLGPACCYQPSSFWGYSIWCCGVPCSFTLSVVFVLPADVRLPAVCRLHRTHLGITMEYVAGGNMADYILKTILLKFGSFDTRDGLVMEEDEARYFFTQV